MLYSLEPKEVKKVITAYLNDKPYDEKQFLFYHLNRNYFNVKGEIKTLKKIVNNKFIDNLQFVWEEQPPLKNFSHMSKFNWAASAFGLAKPETRKFLRDDNVTGVDGEFEIIIRTKDGKRIDALTDESYQETYNYGRTRKTADHKKIDFYTHYLKGSNYSFKMDMGFVKIIE